jgi:hypothetical protein
MRILAAIAFGLAYVSIPLTFAESADTPVGRDPNSRAASRAIPLDWKSSNVRIEVSGEQTRVILRLRTFKGDRRLDVNFVTNDADSSVTLVYRVITSVGPMTNRGLNFERSDLDVVWTFDTRQFEKMKAQRKFFVLCKGEGADIG